LFNPANESEDIVAQTARAHLVLSLLNAHLDWTHRYEVDDYPRLARLAADIVLNGVIGSAGMPAAMHPRLPAPPLPSDPTAEAFLRAATLLVNDQGYRGASIDKIAAVLNATKGKFYHYNDAKLELITTCFERSFDVLRHYLDQAEQLDASGAQRFAAFVEALVSFQLSERGPLLLGSAFSALPDQNHRIGVARTRLQLDTRIGSILVGGLVDNSVRALDPALAAELVHAAIAAAAELRRWMPNQDPTIVARLYAEPITYGILHQTP
jgi:AcrR family transcriptional regulator